MPPSLHYDIVTDPTSLQASQPGVPSTGAVYLIISNHDAAMVSVRSIEVQIPVGDNAGHLTPHPELIKRSFEVHPPVSNTPVQLTWDGVKSFRLETSPKTAYLFDPGETIVLKLENIAVSAEGGLALLTITEISKPPGVQGNFAPHTLMLGLVKETPKAPRNFRPDKDMVDVSANGSATLMWDGPNNIDYWIVSPDAQPVKFSAAPAGTPVAQTPFTHKVQPTRGTTYTLMAGTSPGQPNGQGYIFTTTVHARIPEFESGVRTPWAEGTPAKGQGRVTFTPQGVDINKTGGGLGTVTADEARLTTAVRTKRARGLDDNDGWVEFPPDGIKVGHGSAGDLGTVSANGVNTIWVGDRNGGKGWIEFPDTGVKVYKSAGDWGTVTAGEADLADLFTRRATVRERLTVEGGLTVNGVLETQDGPPRLVVHGQLDAEGELKAAGNAVVGGDLSVNGKLELGELRVARTADIGGDLSVNGRVNAGSELHTAGKAVVGGDLDVNGTSTLSGMLNAGGGLTVSYNDEWVLKASHDRVQVAQNLYVQHDSVFTGVVNANGLLSVRNSDAWIMHVNDDQVSIQGNLRVHGAFRSDD
ncbi:hypothetical protein ACWGDX_12830 [Streptomyces sp. NPDC055025]